MHDIYDPIYTSEEESNSEDTDSSFESRRSQESLEESSYGTGENESSSSMVSPVSKEDDVIGQSKNINENYNEIQLGKTTDEFASPSRMLKEEDLDYNSENNHSSLSSIHKEIQDIHGMQLRHNHIQPV